MPKTKLNKQEKYWINQYIHAEDFSVETAYRRPSATKIAIEDDILNKMYEVGGNGYRILSHNGFHFSCAFKSSLGDNIYLIVCTPSRWYIMVPLKTVNPETGEIKYWTDKFDFS